MKWMSLLLFGGMGLSLLVSGLIWGRKRYALFHGGLRARGTVVENYKSVSTSRREDRPRETVVSESYYPVVEFTTRQGESIRFRGSTGSGVPEYETGTPVDVLYDPAKPHEAQMAAFSQLWLGPAVLTGLGLLIFIMGTGAFFMIGESDREMEATRHSVMRSMLKLNEDSIRITGTIREVRALEGKHAGKYVFICSAVTGKNGWEEFESEAFNYDPGPELDGRQVDIYLDPYDKGNYFVDLDPLLPEIVR